MARRVVHARLSGVNDVPPEDRTSLQAECVDLTIAPDTVESLDGFDSDEGRQREDIDIITIVSDGVSGANQESGRWHQGDSERAKASGVGDKTSLTWTSTRLEGISTSSSGKSHSNPPGHGDFRGKPKREPNERNKHFAMSHHERRPPGLLRLHVEWKPW
ncbi:hypothetical protein MRX96_021105 [Rhipicephalus microplus]